MRQDIEWEYKMMMKASDMRQCLVFCQLLSTALLLAVVILLALRLPQNPPPFAIAASWAASCAESVSHDGSYRPFLCEDYPTAHCPNHWKAIASWTEATHPVPPSATGTATKPKVDSTDAAPVFVCDCTRRVLCAEE